MVSSTSSPKRALPPIIAAARRRARQARVLPASGRPMSASPGPGHPQLEHPASHRLSPGAFPPWLSRASPASPASPVCPTRPAGASAAAPARRPSTPARAAPELTTYSMANWPNRLSKRPGSQVLECKRMLPLRLSMGTRVDRSGHRWTQLLHLQHELHRALPSMLPSGLRLFPRRVRPIVFPPVGPIERIHWPAFAHAGPDGSRHADTMTKSRDVGLVSRL